MKSFLEKKNQRPLSPAALWKVLKGKPSDWKKILHDENLDHHKYETFSFEF